MDKHQKEYLIKKTEEMNPEWLKTGKFVEKLDKVLNTLERILLLVEDDELQEKILRKILSGISEDLVIVSASKGEEALEYIRNNPDQVKIMILDLALPDISGLQVLKEMQEMSEKVPVVALSANEDKDIIVQAMQRGAKNYFVKGKNKKELQKFYTAIAEILEPKLNAQAVGHKVVKEADA